MCHSFEFPSYKSCATISFHLSDCLSPSTGFSWLRMDPRGLTGLGDEKFIMKMFNFLLIQQLFFKLLLKTFGEYLN